MLIFNNYYLSVSGSSIIWLYSTRARWIGIQKRWRNHCNRSFRSALVDGRSRKSQRSISSHLCCSLSCLKVFELVRTSLFLSSKPMSLKSWHHHWFFLNLNYILLLPDFILHLINENFMIHNIEFLEKFIMVCVNTWYVVQWINIIVDYLKWPKYTLKMYLYIF